VHYFCHFKVKYGLRANIVNSGRDD